MEKSPEQKDPYIERFVAWLHEHKKNRGVMADLRHGLSPATEYRAWPHVAPWLGKDFTKDYRRTILLTIGAAFAIQQEIQTETRTGRNLGAVLRRIALNRGGGASVEEGLATFDARFRRILSCDSAVEVCAHLGGVFRAAERLSPPEPIDLVRLYEDLSWWGDQVKVAWAGAYWGALEAEKQAKEETA